MAALFYTNHKMNEVQDGFKRWLNLWRAKKANRGSPEKTQAQARAVPAIQIDTELANAQYENAEMQQLESIGDHLQGSQQNSEGIEQEVQDTSGNMIHIEGEADIYNDINNDSSKVNSPEKEVDQGESEESDQQYKDED